MTVGRVTGTSRILSRRAGGTQAEASNRKCYGEDVSRQVRFGLYEFDADSGALTREGAAVRLQPQPARVLALLVARAPDIVTRDALRQEVWNDGTFVDFERGLNFCIAQIRSALGDAADSPRFIQTLPKRGYRFIAPVQPLAERPRSGRAAESPSESERGCRLRQGYGEPRRSEADAGDSTSAEKGLPNYSSQPGTGWPGRRHLMFAGFVGLALVTAALVAGAWRSASVDRRVRIAVVPFDNETGTDDFDRIARGVADATVARLATPERVAALAVIGNAAALHQPRAFRDLQRIGVELDADYIVLAQMKRDAAGVRLIAHLIRVRDQAHVWANTYDRPGFTLDVQAEIAESIASAVARTLAEAPSHRARTS
jgi:DNA-binding winged helix-turn-helix (wHTH) protein/TolB-like protein